MQDDMTELHEYPQAMFGGAEVFVLEDEDTGDALRVLYVGGGFQSATFMDNRRFELVFEYYRAFDVLFDALSVTQGCSVIMSAPAGQGEFPVHAPAAQGELSCAADTRGALTAQGKPLVDAPVAQDEILRASGLRNAPAHAALAAESCIGGGSARGADAEMKGDPSADSAVQPPLTPRILMLGAGGCSYPKYLIAHFPHVQVDAVEIDPVVLEIARKHFYVDEAIERFGAQDRLRLIAADALDFLASSTDCYDAILNDCFGGQELVRNLANANAARLVKRHLNPGGVYLANVVSAESGADISAIQNVATTLAQVFAHVSVIPCFDEDYAGEDNYLVMATDAPYEPEGALDPALTLVGEVIV